MKNVIYTRNPPSPPVPPPCREINYGEDVKDLIYIFAVYLAALIVIPLQIYQFSTLTDFFLN